MQTQNYDGIILITDQSRYAMDHEREFTGFAENTPLWILHLDKMAPAYDDAVLDYLYRSGGAAVSGWDALVRKMSTAKTGHRIAEHYQWEISGLPEPSAASEPDPNLAALAARQFILASSYGAKPDLETLDRLHELATTYDVVTPYSSMIVLVNDAQKEALKAANERDDRFEREGRSGEENLTSPSSPLVSAVPEPHEWLLIILSLCLLLYVWQNRGRWTAISELR